MKMKLDAIEVSCPVAAYTAHISHHRERRPNVIEWAILHALDVARSHPEYAALPVAQVFSTFFGFPENPNDLDALLKPLFTHLFSDDVITSLLWNDQASLEMFHMQDFQLTEKGLQFLRDGRLPVEPTESSVRVLYDIEKQTLLPELAAYPAEPRGLALADAAEAQQMPFPVRAVQEQIERRRKKRQRGAWAWLTPQTKMDGIRADLPPEIRWRTVTRELSLTPELGAALQSVTDERIVQDALQRLDFGVAGGSELPQLSPNDFLRIRALHPLHEAESHLRTALAEHPDWCLLPIEQAALLPSGKDAPRLAVLLGAPALAITVDPKARRIRMELPAPMPQAGALLESSTRAFHAGILPVHAGDFQRELPVLYEPAAAFDFPSWAKQTAAAYAAQDIRALLLLAASCQMTTLHTMSNGILAALPKETQDAAKVRLQKAIHDVYGFQKRKGNVA